MTEAQKRYRLHYNARKLGAVLATKNRTFYEKYDTTPPLIERNKYAALLIQNFGYVVQLEIC